MRKFITARSLNYVESDDGAHIRWGKAVSLRNSMIESVFVECLGTYKDGEEKENWFVSLFPINVDKYIPDAYFTVSPLFDNESDALNAYNDFINVLNGRNDDDVKFAYNGFEHREEDFI